MMSTITLHCCRIISSISACLNVLVITLQHVEGLNTWDILQLISCMIMTLCIDCMQFSFSAQQVKVAC